MAKKKMTARTAVKKVAKKAAKKAAVKKTARKAARKAAPKKAAKKAASRSSMKRAVAKKATKKAAPRKAVMKKTSAKKTVAKKAASKAKVLKPAMSKAAPKKAVARKTTRPATKKPVMRPELSQDWPRPLQPEVTVKQGEGEEPSAELQTPQPKPFKSFAKQAREHKAKPNEQHPGQTAQSGASNDRPGSQPERVRHLYPNANKPNAGSGRSTNYKGKRLENGNRVD